MCVSDFAVRLRTHITSILNVFLISGSVDKGEESDIDEKTSEDTRSSISQGNTQLQIRVHNYMYMYVSPTPHPNRSHCVVSCYYYYLHYNHYYMGQCMRFPTMWYVRPAKAQISLPLRAVWSLPLLIAWIFYVEASLWRNHLIRIYTGLYFSTFWPTSLVGQGLLEIYVSWP